MEARMWTFFVVGLSAGIAATPHCLGMCGGFPLHLSKSSGKGKALSRLLLFVIGKAFTYVFLGSLAASLGVIVFKNTSLTSYAPALKVAAGIMTVVFGLSMLGLRLPPVKALQGISESGMIKSLFGGLLTDPSPVAAFALGLGVGFIPCPLPMGMLAVSIAHPVTEAIALMAGVGLGTAPGLLAVGLFGVGLDRRFARVGIRIAGVIVLAIGLLTIAHATGILGGRRPPGQAPPCCSEGAR